MKVLLRAISALVLALALLVGMSGAAAYATLATVHQVAPADDEPWCC